MAETKKSAPDPAAFDMNAAVNQAIGECGGDLVATVRSLVVANNFLIARNAELVKELDWAWHWISPGYTRSTNKRRMTSGEPE